MTPHTIQEIIKEFENKFEDMLNFVDAQAGINERQNVEKWFHSILTSFEATIRADEANNCNGHIQKALTSHTLSLIEGLEGMKCEDHISGVIAANTYNLALTAAQDLLRKSLV